MVCETFFSVKNFCVEGHATEVWNGVLKRTAWLLKRKQQPGGAIRTEQANLSFHSTWCRYFPSFPSLCEKPYLTSHATHFPQKMRWNVLSLYSPSLEDTFKEEGGIFSLARNSMFKVPKLEFLNFVEVFYFFQEYCGVLSKWEFFIKMRAAFLALSSLHNLGEDGGKKSSSHFDEKLSFW